MKKGIVFVECPICKGLGLGTDLNGKQRWCPACHSVGFMTTPLDTFEDGIRTDERAKQSIKCSNCANHLTTSAEAQIRLDERKKFAGWCYVHGISFCFMGHIDECGNSDVPKIIENIIERYEKEQKEETNEPPVQVTSAWQVYTKEHTVTGQIYTNAEDAEKCAEAIDGYVVEARLIEKEGVDA